MGEPRKFVLGNVMKSPLYAKEIDLFAHFCGIHDSGSSVSCSGPSEKPWFVFCGEDWNWYTSPIF